MAVCTLCFCSLNLDAQETGKTTIRSLTHRDWIWQCSDNMFIYMHFDKKTVTATMYSRSSWSWRFNTHIPNKYNSIHSELIIRNEGTIWCYLQEELLCHLFLR